jgi:hypothetical protein
MLVDTCIDCVIIGACRQFRMHNSRNCKVVLHITSGPIIEDCQGITFAPFVERLHAPSFAAPLGSGEGGKSWWESKLVEASLDFNMNKWNEVEDFNWLRKQKSPNWDAVTLKVLEEDGSWQGAVVAAEGEGSGGGFSRIQDFWVRGGSSGKSLEGEELKDVIGKMVSVKFIAS